MAHGLYIWRSESFLGKLCFLSSVIDVWGPSELTFDLPQELLNQVCGDVLSTCVHCLSNIVLKEDGAGNMDEDLLVSNYFS